VKPAARLPILAATATSLLLASLVATAGDAALATCKNITVESERLACYDRLSGFAPPPAPDGPAPARRSLIDEAWAFGPDANRYALRYYRPNYILVARYTDDVNQEPFSPLFDAAESDEELDDIEARFQLSFKNRIWASEDYRWGLWVAYTQQSQWQVYNGDVSRPFRETNYKPEVMMSFRPDIKIGSLDWRLLNFGYVHQSNGRSQVLSRSWDRLYVEAGVERNNFALLARGWYRIPESSSDDDNPDINRFMGYGDLNVIYKWRDHSFSVMGRGNWNTGKGAVRAGWVTPPLLGPLRGYVQAFSGYGDSMIDYNWNQNIVGIGIALNDVL